MKVITITILGADTILITTTLVRIRLEIITIEIMIETEAGSTNMTVKIFIQITTMMVLGEEEGILLLEEDLSTAEEEMAHFDHTEAEEEAPFLLDTSVIGNSMIILMVMVLWLNQGLPIDPHPKNTFEEEVAEVSEAEEGDFKTIIHNHIKAIVMNNSRTAIMMDKLFIETLHIYKN
ncbi:hypothetical protein Ocin01_13915 [Orchesella cincta]|uniref:Uncharacterized protein n=1 Tax=Orchesella cincta TaxID=48709 RepID=A0A1D2MID3_ORCCI|nr:hypothetical protein Ocin01_13915 [Orchesella cincta]